MSVLHKELHEEWLCGLSDAVWHRQAELPVMFVTTPSPCCGLLVLVPSCASTGNCFVPRTEGAEGCLHALGRGGARAGIVVVGAAWTSGDRISTLVLFSDFESIAHGPECQ